MFLTNIVRRQLAPGGHSRCGNVVQGVVVAAHAPEAVIEQRQADTQKASASAIVVIFAAAVAIYVFVNTPLF